MNELKAKRAAALEAKKARLEALKARRSNREKGGGVSTGAPSAVSASKTGNLDEYIDSLLHSPPPGGASAAVTSASSVATTASGTSMSTATTTEAMTKAKGVGFVEPAAPLSKIDQMNQSHAAMDSDSANASMGQTPQSPVKKVETFTMSTQTAEDEFPMPLDGENEDVDDDELEIKKSETGNGDDDETMQGEEQKSDNPMKEPVLLTEEEVNDTYSSQPFSTFFNSASKKVERLLGAPLLSDLLVDDLVYYADKESKIDASASSAKDKKSLVSAKVSFSFPKWTANRSVTSLDWSPHHRGEVMLASYHMPNSSSGLGSGSTALSSLSKNDNASSASLLPRTKREMTGADGLTILWNLAMPSRPEHIFTCGSPVLNAKFHPTEGSLVVGACYSGQVVVWDVRTNGRLPVQKSKLNILGGGNVSGGHVHPIVGMEAIDVSIMISKL